jgi:aryl-alcohol dehydrogenase-like predicted oxidoreductase
MRCLALSDRHGWQRFVAMQNHYNLIYREEEREMMPLCRSEGVGVIPWSPLARGLLAGSRKSREDKESTVRAGNDPLADFLYREPSDWEVVEAVLDVARERGIAPAEVALAWLLSRPGVTAPIVGATRLAHLETAIAAVDVTLGEEEVKRLEAPYRPHAVAGH